MPFKPRKNPVHNIPTFRWGLNDLQESDELQDYEMADCENVSIETDSLMSANGYQYWDENPKQGPFWGIFQFRKSDGSQQLIRQRQGKLEYDSDEAGTWLECTLPTEGSPAENITLTETYCSFAQLNDIILFANGTDSTMQSTDGITWTIPTSGSPAVELPKAKVVFNNGANRVLFLNQPASPYRVDWSNINDPLTINASSYQLIDPNSNGPVMGAALAPDGTNLIFKQGALYQVSDYTVNGMIDVNFISAIQFSNHRTIATTEDSVIFCCYNWVYEFMGGVIRPIMGRIKFSGRNDVVNFEKFCGAYSNQKYYLSMPDRDISEEYNSQEYVIYKKLRRQDEKQPYAITRNRRYWNCYGHEVYEYGDGQVDFVLYAGDSRPTSTGSPAVASDLFVWIDEYRTGEFGEGTAGVAQSGYFITKFFDDDIPFYVKRFKKLFTNFKVANDTTLTIGYRFLPYGSFDEVTETATSEELEFDEGFGFSEDYGFSLETLGQIFTDIENADKPRGIQFKISFNQISDVTILGLAYQFRVKGKFK